ncbi:glycosyltransferase [Pseudactinotalea terrae]|uniref:glycosyltransferase n=1 Tax=Pseudactinotalea terrae TaxID=1743262 RepID=UPI0012E2ACEA|nr:glycosyltransferase [Pseudactinotalea terrae]
MSEQREEVEIGSAGARPRVSVIIPVRDDPRLTACLEALSHQSYPAELVEIIVADNGSTSPVAELLDSFPMVHLVEEPAGGSYAARNAAVAQSTGEVLAFTDSDCLPDESWLEESVAALAGGADIVAGHVTVYARDDRRPHPVEAYELVHAFPQEIYAQRGGGSVTANMVTTRAAFEAAGPFRSELYSGADIEWSQRANSMGMQTAYSGAAVVRHPARDSYQALSKKLERVLTGRHERDVLDGGPAAAPWPGLRSLVPPLGAFRRAGARALLSPRARAAFVVGEFYHRYASARQAFDLARRTRRQR